MVQLADLRFHRRDAAPHVAARPKGCYTGPATVVPEDFDAIVIFADLAGGKLTQKGDFNALVVVAQAGGDFFLLDFWVKRAAFPEVQEQVRRYARRHPHARKIIESAASGASLVASLEHEISGLVGQVAKGDKESRLESVLAFFEAGNVHFPDGRPGLDEVIAQLVTFPNATHDDFVDAMSGALEALATNGRPEVDYVKILREIRGETTPEDDEAELADVDPDSDEAADIAERMESTMKRRAARQAAAALIAKQRADEQALIAKLDAGRLAAQRAQAARDETIAKRLAERKRTDRDRRRSTVDKEST
jgi:predicted phage terminase large subunit-like protein